MIRFLRHLGLLTSIILILSSCNPKTYKKINYLQDVQRDTIMKMNRAEGILVQPQDMISIVVSSRTPELAAPFNLANISYQAGSETGNVASGGYRLMGYSVDSEGNIDFPILGEINVAGLNRWGVAQKVKDRLQSSGLLKDPVVTVEFMNFKISVIGEVNRPGSYTVSGDKINILQALSLAGDMTIYGRRDNVMVVREQNGSRVVYVLDIRNSDLFNSPAYYLQQNDEVYIEPNRVRAGQSTINENSFKSVGFWTSLSATLVTIVNLIITISRK